MKREIGKKKNAFLGNIPTIFLSCGFSNAIFTIFYGYNLQRIYVSDSDLRHVCRININEMLH